MCLATVYWAGLDGLVFGASTTDSKIEGGFDGAVLYKELARPTAERKIPEIQMPREEAVAVWKEYATLPNKVPY